jgi:hypothetical protein
VFISDLDEGTVSSIIEIIANHNFSWLTGKRAPRERKAERLSSA